MPKSDYFWRNLCIVVCIFSIAGSSMAYNNDQVELAAIFFVTAALNLLGANEFRNRIKSKD